MRQVAHPGCTSGASGMTPLNRLMLAVIRPRQALVLCRHENQARPLRLSTDRSGTNNAAAKRNYALRRNDREPRCEDRTGISPDSCPACPRFLEACPKTPFRAGSMCNGHRCEAIWSAIHSPVEAGERTAGTWVSSRSFFIAFLNDIPGRHRCQRFRHRPARHRDNGLASSLCWVKLFWGIHCCLAVSNRPMVQQIGQPRNASSTSIPDASEPQGWVSAIARAYPSAAIPMAPRRICSVSVLLANMIWLGG